MFSWLVLLKIRQKIIFCCYKDSVRLWFLIWQKLKQMWNTITKCKIDYKITSRKIPLDLTHSGNFGTITPEWNQTINNKNKFYDISKLAPLCDNRIYQMSAGHKPNCESAHAHMLFISCTPEFLHHRAQVQSQVSTNAFSLVSIEIHLLPWPSRKKIHFTTLNHGVSYRRAFHTRTRTKTKR